jgi:adenylate cyclase
MHSGTSTESEETWRTLLTTRDAHAWIAGRRVMRLLPSSPRCKMCNAPFHGPAGAVLRFAGFRPATVNPNFCGWCERWAKTHPGGAEIPLSLLFADVRNSTPLARSLGDAGFSDLINRFYVTATDALIARDAMISRMVGDEVVAMFLPVVLGDRHASVAVEAARELLRATGHEEPDGPWLPIGAGVHTGKAHVGLWGAENGVRDFTALGAEVSLTARLAQVARAGEILMTDETRGAAGIEEREMTRRRVELKGFDSPMDLWSLSMTPATSLVS